MRYEGRRSVLGTPLGLAAAGTLSRPYIANAQARTSTVWVNQGFIPQEDAAFRKLADDYMKESGNKLDHAIMPFMALNQKTISALTSGDVPDLIFMDAPATILPQNAWDDKLVDLTDVVSAYEAQLTKTAQECSTFFNKAAQKRSYYLAPIKQGCIPFHVWGNLVKEAGLDLSAAPKTWDAFWDFFKPAQKTLHGKGMRRTYALGLQVTTVGPNDGTGLFQSFLIANGGQDIVTSDGRLHTDDPKVREAAIRSCTYLTDAYKGGFIPPEALSWNDADDNNAFQEKVIVIDFDGTLSTELAMIDNKQDYNDVVTMGLTLGNDCKPIPAQVNAGSGFNPKTARNVAVAKDLMRRLMQPLGAGERADRRGRPVLAQILRRAPCALCA